MSVNLQKGQKISLSKEAGSALSTIFMGLGWDVAEGSGSIDLDASCLMFDDKNAIHEIVYFGQLTSRCGSVKHTGDNLTGAGEGDDEVINVDLSKVPSNVKSLVFTVNSYSGQAFNEVKNAFCRLVNSKNGQEIAKYVLSGGGSHNALIMSKVYRHSGEWKMHAIGDPAQGRTAQELQTAVCALL